MKANRLVFENSIDVNPRSGIIKFNGNRMVLKSAEALGLFRRDIIQTLNMERAKGFLLRYGWACGYSAGGSIEKIYNWKEINELIMAGAAIHTLEGVVSVQIDLLEVSDDKFEMEGKWFHSYEAEEHVRHFGFSEEGVCWTLIGYVAGFLAKVYPKEVVVYEEKCRGKRDEYCKFVVCTKDHATAEQLDILRYFKDTSLADELDATYNELKILNNSIVYSDSIHKQMTHAMLEGYTLNQLLHLLGDALKCSVAIERRYLMKPIGYYFMHEADEHLYVGASRTKKEFRHEYEILTMKKQLGTLVVLSHQEMTREQEMIIERSVTVFSVYLYTQMQIAQSQWKRKSDFLDEIMNWQSSTEALIKKARNIFYFDPSKNNRVIVITSEHEEPETLHSFLTTEYLNIECFIKNQEVLLILEECEQNDAYIPNFIKQLTTCLKERFKQSVFKIGAGQSAEKLEKIGSSYNEARLICQFLCYVTPLQTQSAIYENFQHIMLFLKTTNPRELLQFYEEVLEDLLKYDVQNNATLIYTLEVYLNQNGNVNKTAKALNLSIPGFRYRMEKIESLLRDDIRTGDGRFRCQLALKVYYAIEALGIKK
ncbi:XylR N-terminal domain-containing protein [Lysinibacillus sp. NPDC096418]|uniref:XylR N-terminal domain-containing protein n=1 Tax=Lysinibacillus sp. NPDC096418 TaxID=3364138 RepID=UPI00381F4DDE